MSYECYAYRIDTYICIDLRVGGGGGGGEKRGGGGWGRRVEGALE